MANEKANTPAQALGEKIIEMGRRELCELIIALCEQIQDQVGTDHYRGGVYPGNIRVTDDGPVLGPASESGWQGEELRFLAPELYWKGERTSAGDVYSLGLLLYYAVDNGRLPFAKDGEETAAQRRLNGETFPAPRAAGRRLGEIISKATAFRAAERYQNVAELKAVLLSCVKMYLSGAPSAKALFQKDEEELSQVERMMVSILRRDAEHTAEIADDEKTDEDNEVKEHEEETIETSADLPEEGEQEKAAADEIRAEEAKPDAEEAAAAEGAGDEPESPAEEESRPTEEEDDVKIVPPAPEKAQEPIPILEVEKNPELEPVVIDWPTAEIRYGTNVERERKIAETVKKRRRRPALAVVLLCVLLLGVAAISKAINDHNNPPLPVSDTEPTPPAAEGPVAPTPAGAAALEELETPEETETPAETPKPESTYQLYIEDVSWTEARDRCTELGGHLAVISDKAEFDKVVALAETYGVDMVWVGCRRTEGTLQWVTGEEVGFWPWGEDEPSYADSYDDVAEDYILLWNVVGDWSYNDSRNDPVSAYPAAYTGRIAFVCEFEG